MLNVIRHDSPGAASPLVIAHGLFGSGRNWGVIARRLADRGPVLASDMRNHGDSPRGATNSYEDMAADLAEVIEAEGAQVDLCGHSMGGKAAMVLALTRPELLRRVVIADIAPKAYSHSQNHLIAAMRQVDLAAVESRGDADAMLAPHVAEKGLRAFLLQSLDVKARRWKLNLDVLEAEMSTVTGWPGTTGRFDGPALFLTGAESDYVSRDDREVIRDLFPKARFAALPGAGHWLHADRPREFEAALRVFLDA